MYKKVYAHDGIIVYKQQSKPDFNLHIIDYVHNTTLYTKPFLQSHNLQNLINPQQLNINQTNSTHIHNLHTRNDITLTKPGKTMGWALIPTSWFTDEYPRHFTHTTTYRRIDSFDLTTIITGTPTNYENFNYVLTSFFLHRPTNNYFTLLQKTNFNYPTWNSYQKSTNWLIQPPPSTLTNSLNDRSLLHTVGRLLTLHDY